MLRRPSPVILSAAKDSRRDCRRCADPHGGWSVLPGVLRCAQDDNERAGATMESHLTMEGRRDNGELSRLRGRAIYQGKEEP